MKKQDRPFVAEKFIPGTIRFHRDIRVKYGIPPIYRSMYHVFYKDEGKYGEIHDHLLSVDDLFIVISVNDERFPHAYVLGESFLGWVNCR